MPLKLIARNQTTPILSKYWEQSPGRAINFDPFHTIATVFNLLYYMHHYFLPGVIAFIYLIPNYGEKDGYYPSLWMIQLTLDSPIQSLTSYKFLQKH